MTRTRGDLAIASRLVFAALFFFAFSCAQSAAGAIGSAAQVDRTVVLSVGPVQISQYALEKNYKRFFDDPKNGRGGFPSQTRVRDWFGLFIARQVLTAEAISRGIGQEPGVLRIVNTMERYMLSEFDGPFYEGLYPKWDYSQKDLEALYMETSKVIEVTVVKYPAGRRRELLGDDWAQASEEGRLLRLSVKAGLMGAAFYEGNLRWPYNFLDEYGARDAIARAEVGAWIEGDSMDVASGEKWIVFIRSIRRQSVPAFASAQDNFRQAVHFINRVTFARQRRAGLLRESRFSFDERVASDLASRIGKLDPRTIDLPRGLTAGIGGSELAGYGLHKERIRITADDWLEYYNGLFMRRLPTSPALVRLSAEDMAVEDMDCAEAHDRGIDQTPQFSEDRRNFWYASTLDAFEKTQIEPFERTPTENREREEMEMASRLRGRFRIVDRIPYGKYGLFKEADQGTPEPMAQ